MRYRETDERDLEISWTRNRIGEITMENELLHEWARRAEATHHFDVAEAGPVAARVSRSAGKRYGLARICRVLGLARSTAYAERQRALKTAWEAQKRGLRTDYGDGELTELVRWVR